MTVPEELAKVIGSQKPKVSAKLKSTKPTPKPAQEKK
jgi:hypothetical protein